MRFNLCNGYRMAIHSTIGGQEMTKHKLKTQFTESELLELLEFYNTTKTILNDMSENFTTDTSNLHNLQFQMHKVQQTFKFRPRADEHGEPLYYYADHVLANHKKAYYPE